MLRGDIQRSIDGVFKFAPSGAGTEVQYDPRHRLGGAAAGVRESGALKVRILNTVRELKVRAEG